MRRTLLACAAFVAIVAGDTASAHEDRAARALRHGQPRLVSGLGPLHHRVTTKNLLAQKFFDQGLRWIYAFNHQEASASFRRAAALDPSMAMAHWGIALALGPYYNAPEMGPLERAAAQDEIGRARLLARNATPRERAYIDALALRFADPLDADPDKPAKDYRDAMQGVMREHPGDPDAATLFAEAGMVLRPWRLWNADGTPAEGTDEIVAALESVLARDPDHVGANHYYIHAIEASPHPERALPAARRLPRIAPAAGHLVHMAAHIYDRIGDHAGSARANAAAIAADRKYLAALRGSNPYVGYYAHNLHFLAFSHAQQGRYRDAIAAARAFGRHVASTMPEVPGVAGFLPAPAMIHTRFQRWDAILPLPRPPDAFTGPQAVWHFARGMAFVARGDVERAAAERAGLAKAVERLSPDEAWGRNRAADVLGLAAALLDGNLAWARGERSAAIRTFDEGALAEDALAYDEPAPWYLPLREALGAALLANGDAAGAERAFSDDLLRHPNSGRALHGLVSALKAQGKPHDDAERLQAKAWRNADSKPVLPLVAK